VLTLCWIIKSYLIYLIITIGFTILLKTRFTEKADKLPNETFIYLDNTRTLVVFLVIHTFAVQVNYLSILVGQIFNKTFYAKTASILVWLFSLANIFSSSAPWFKYAASCLPNLALNFCFDSMLQYERSYKKLGATNLFTSFYEDDVNVGALLVVMNLWSVVYLTLSWYLERVNPGEYGVKLPLFFPFMPSYWTSNVKIKFSGSGGGDHEDSDAFEDEESMLDNVDSDKFEKDPVNLRATVKLKKMTKKFYTGFGKKTAVDSLSLNFYQDQITGFLGHNGAGKTTVTFVLCGLYAPSSGTAEILDHDIRLHLNRVRHSIGFCPQVNILFDKLTVYQHLQLVCQLKGFTRARIVSEIERIAQYVGLSGDLSKQAGQLSGGMKRRLSVGMAFIGDSKVIILDEPTSGLDPCNRRSLWDLIRNYKTGRTIILTTHYMEEADALCDRIALMKHGALQCCGSPLYLKEKFGSGYTLTASKGPAFDAARMAALVQQSVEQELEVQHDIAREVCYSIPVRLSGKLPELLHRVEMNKQAVGILNYGISSSTIEDVYIK
jgi:ATP-binding cassette subfamily A (ABC1) protein 3